MSAPRAPVTTLIHHDYLPPAGFASPATPVCKGSTVFFADTAALRARSWHDKTGYTYGLHGTPTSFTLEERIATLEGGRRALLVPSGLAAITLVDMALLKAGDHVLLPDNAYGAEQGASRATSWRAGASRTASTTRWTRRRWPPRSRPRRGWCGSRRRAR